MDKQDYENLNKQSWSDYLNGEISPNELDKQLEDNREEWDKYGY